MQISNLEIELEKLESGLKNAQQQAQNAAKARNDFRSAQNEIERWIAYADKSLQSTTGEPQIMKENLQSLMNQLPKITDQEVDTLKTCYGTIVTNSPDENEKATCKSIVDSIDENIARLKGIMEERKAKIGESLDSWQRFLQLWRHVMNWVEDKKKLLAQPLTVATLDEAKQKFNVYAVS